MADASRHGSRATPTPSRQQSQTVDPENAAITAVVAKCKAIIDEYRKLPVAERDRGVTTIQILEALPSESAELGSYSKVAIFNSYLQMLDKSTELEDGGIESEKGSEAGEEETGIGGRGRNRGPSSRSSRDSSPEPEPKRRKADPSKFDWKARELLTKTTLRPELARTLDLLRNYGADLKYARKEVMLSPNCPEFPEGEWTNVLAGHAVDLDKIFSGIYATTRENVTVGHIGDLRIEHNDTVPVHKIVNAHQWNNAWQRTIRATTFAFQHRRSELEEYGAWISGIFMSLDERYHYRVLNLDKAIRKRVGNQRSILLTDTHRFDDLKTSHLSEHGAAVALKADTGNSQGMESRRSSGSRSGEKLSEPCIRWNQGRCTMADGCKYQHACSKCDSEAHTVDNCPLRM